MILSVPCEFCADATSMKQNFCSHCGARTQGATVELLNIQIADLAAQIGELKEARKGTEQRFLEVDTAEKVVARVMTWAKAFGFFAGIPILIVVIILSILAGKSYKSFSDIIAQGKSSVENMLEKARADSGKAE
jgi:hypothetical protein